MALKWIEGFELDYLVQHAARKYAFTSGSGGNLPGRIHGQSLNMSASGTTRRTPSLGLSNTWVLGFALYVPANFTAGTQGFYFLKNTTEQVSLRFVNTSTHFNLQISRAGTQLGLTTNNFAYGVWHYFELKVTVNTATGSYELRHNESVVSSGTSLNTANEGTNGADIFQFQFTSAGNNIRLDDLYLLDTSGSAPQNDYLGDCTVEGILPNAEGSLLEWSVNSGTHFSKVDDVASGVPTDGTDIINSNTNGQRDTFNFPDLTQINGTIYGVMMTHQAAMNAAGSRTLKHKFRNSGGTLADGGNYTVTSTTYGGFTYLWEQNPISLAAWTNSDIDGGQFGVECVS